MNLHSGGTVKLLDCTIRDGGYLTNWDFEKKIVRETYRAVSKAGVDYFEAGYRGTEEFFDKNKYGLWRFSAEDDINEVCNGIHGAKLAIMADYGKIATSDFAPKEESNVYLVRLASHKNTMKDALVLLQEIKAKGYETSIQAMGYSGYSEKERKELAVMLEGSSVNYAYMADSYGSIFPDQIEKMLEPLLKLRPSIQIGFHPHNNLQMAFANSLEAIRCGVDIIDGSIFGMGRGAGNLPIEIVLLYLSERVPDKYNVVPILNCIDRYYIAMQESIGWGYQLSYMLSGLLQCHPSYAQKLVDLKEYTMEDILKALDCINKKKPVGFSEEILTDVINQGIIGGLSQVKTSNGNNRKRSRAISDNTSVPYIDRHKGETFLILANGPTLKEYNKQIKRFIEKHHPVVLGANYLGDILVPDYHAFCNKRRFVSYMDTVSEKSKLLLGQHIPKEMIREYTQRDYESISYLDTLNNDFGIHDGIIQCNCRSVSVLLLGLAIVMGADNIFAAGLDGYLNTDANGNILFYDEHDEKQDAELIRDLHRWNYRFISQINSYFLEMGKGGIHILTPTGYSEFYQGINNYI